MENRFKKNLFIHTLILLGFVLFQQTSVSAVEVEHYEHSSYAEADNFQEALSDARNALNLEAAFTNRLAELDPDLFWIAEGIVKFDWFWDKGEGVYVVYAYRMDTYYYSGSNLFTSAADLFKSDSQNTHGKLPERQIKEFRSL